MGVQRILKVEYALPSHVVVTPECQDLLSKILAGNPAQRISLREVQKHPWFTKELPPGVAEMNDRLLSDPTYYHSAPTQVSIRLLLRMPSQSLTAWHGRLSTRKPWCSLW